MLEKCATTGLMQTKCICENPSGGNQHLADDGDHCLADGSVIPKCTADTCTTASGDAFCTVQATKKCACGSKIADATGSKYCFNGTDAVADCASGDLTSDIVNADKKCKCAKSLAATGDYCNISGTPVYHPKCDKGNGAMCDTANDVCKVKETKACACSEELTAAGEYCNMQGSAPAKVEACTNEGLEKAYTVPVKGACLCNTTLLVNGKYCYGGSTAAVEVAMCASGDIDSSYIKSGKQCLCGAATSVAKEGEYCSGSTHYKTCVRDTTNCPVSALVGGTCKVVATKNCVCAPKSFISGGDFCDMRTTPHKKIADCPAPLSGSFHSISGAAICGCGEDVADAFCYHDGGNVGPAKACVDNQTVTAAAKRCKCGERVALVNDSCTSLVPIASCASVAGTAIKTPVSATAEVYKVAQQCTCDNTVAGYGEYCEVTTVDGKTTLKAVHRCAPGSVATADCFCGAEPTMRNHAKAGQFCDAGSNLSACAKDAVAIAGRCVDNCAEVGAVDGSGNTCVCKDAAFAANGRCQCAPGSGNAIGGCTPCTPGTYSPDGGACAACPAGTYSLAGASGCEKCAIGQVPNTGKTGCEACAAGSISIDGKACTECPAGMIVSGGVQCIGCSIGYGPNEAKTACEPCPAGTYGATSASGVECRSCADGFMSAGGALQCTACDEGKGSSEEHTSCDACQGNTAVVAGVCKDCGSGHASIDHTECKTECTDEVQLVSGQCAEKCLTSQGVVGGVCANCADSGKVAAVGNLACLESCPAGEKLNGKQCEACPTGTPNTDLTGTACTLMCGKDQVVRGKRCGCKAGMAPKDNVCTACAAGTYSDDGAACKPCEKGSTSTEAGAEKCTPECGQGQKYVPAAPKAEETGTCENCTAGTYGDGLRCIKCGTFQTSGAAAAECADCAAGQTVVENACEDCEGNSIISAAGVCTPCAAKHADADRKECVASCGGIGQFQASAADMWCVKACADGSLHPDNVCQACASGIVSLDGEECVSECLSGQIVERGRCTLCSQSKPVTSFDGASCVAACAVSQVVSNGRCVCAAGCYNEEGVCTACAAGSISLDGKSCIACPAGAIVAGGVQCMSCSPGSGPDGNRTACEACAAGAFSADGKACVACAPGTVTTTTGQTACATCAAGQVPASASACEACGADEYVADGISCVACPTGTKPTAPMTGCEAVCKPGQKYDTLASDCASCDAGTYSDDGLTCKPCPAGTQSTAGASECKACTPGQEPNAAKSGCADCKAGTYSADGAKCEGCPINSGSADKATECTPCTPGQGYDAETKACVACGAGSFSADGIACQKCPAGTASDAAVTGACPSCKPGSSAAAGQTACTKCKVDEFSPDGSACQGCPVGGFSKEGAKECTFCAAGEGLNKTFDGCEACQEDSYSADGLVCRPCPTGMYADVKAEACSTCPKGQSFDADDRQCEDCGAGTFSSDGLACIKCAAGHISAAGSTACSTACGPGSHADADACKQCDAGTFSVDGTNCLSCPAGHVSAKGSAFCTACAPGYGPSSTNDACEPCADGQVSAGGAACATVAEAVASADHTRSAASCGELGELVKAEGSRQCVRSCRSSEVVALDGATCVARPSGPTADNTVVVDGKLVCAPGFEPAAAKADPPCTPITCASHCASCSSGTWCLRCNNGYSLNGGKCESQKMAGGSVAGIVIAVLVAFALVGALLYFTMKLAGVFNSKPRRSEPAEVTEEPQMEAANEQHAAVEFGVE